MKHSTYISRLSFLAVILVIGIGAAILPFRLSPRLALPMHTGATPTPTPYSHTIALLGYGGGTHEGGALTDSMIVARIDELHRKIYLISLPRDIWIDLPLGKNSSVSQRLNTAYAVGIDTSIYPDRPSEYRGTRGGGALAKYALSTLIGEPVEHYVAISFATFTMLVDELGGISVHRSYPYVDEWYPIEGKEQELCGHQEDELDGLTATLSGRLLEQEFPCRYERLALPTGENHLDGATALKYVRSRKSDTEGGDFYRSQHQRQVIEAIKEKALSLSSLPSLARVLTKLAQYIDTDIALEDTSTLVSTYLKKKEYEIISIPLTTDNVFKEGSGPQGEYILEDKYDQKDWTTIKTYLSYRYSGLSEASSSARIWRDFSRKYSQDIQVKKTTKSMDQ